LKYVLKNKTYGTYFKTKLYKGTFHYVVDFMEATRLTKQQASKLLNELKHKENYEILKVKEI